MIKDTFEIKVGEKPITIKTTNWTEQASGSCLVQCGETEVLATAVVSPTAKDDIDFFPLTVDYEERFYAAGKIYGSRFIRRESRPTDEAILTSRMIDRAIRPLFPKDFKKEVQVIITCLSWDGENDPDILGLIGASFALSISNIPWSGPVGAVRVSRVNGEWVFNPSYNQRKESDMDLTLSAIEKDGDILVNMIEMGAKEVSEKDVLDATKEVEEELKKIIDFQKKIVEKIGQEKIEFSPAVESGIENEIKEFLGNRLEKEILEAEPKEKNLSGVDALKEELVKFIEGKYPSQGKTKQILPFFEKEIERIIIKNIIEKNQRPDGRKSDEIRKISAEVGVLPRTHGTGLFYRGLTHVLSILTLGGPADQQLLEGMEIVGKKRFLHHYNFPPYSSGETAPMRGPKRRDIGHGNLVEKALLPVIPEPEKFPYTI